MTLLRPISPRVARVFSVLALAAWAGQMALLVDREYIHAASLNMAADLSRYGSAAVWRGIYYRGQKIGFSVSQTEATDEGYEVQEDARLQMSLLGSTSGARMKTVAWLGKAFDLRRFSFSLDPGTGPIEVSGTIDGQRLSYTLKSPSGARSETRTLAQPPMLSLNLPRRLAAAGLEAGRAYEVSIFDPATLSNQPLQVQVGRREVVRAAGLPVAAFRVEMRFGALTSTSWVTDTGEVVKEESPMGMMVLKETRDRATALAVPGEVQMDMLGAVSIVPEGARRIDDPATVELLRVRLTGAPPEGPDLQGAGQSVSGDRFEVRDPESLRPGPADPGAARYLGPEPFLESDAPEIVAEAAKAVGDAREPRARAERLVRYVNALLEKKPTVSLPSAREVLRTRVGDCNEHTALYVAMARAAGIPARVAVGIVYLNGAFYYHAWPEVYLDAGKGTGLWLPVDPTLNQFPADATHIRLARGGLDRQAAILPMIGQARLTIEELRLRPGSTPVLVGAGPRDARPLEIPIPRHDGSGVNCWSSPSRH